MKDPTFKSSGTIVGALTAALLSLGACNKAEAPSPATPPKPKTTPAAALPHSGFWMPALPPAPMRGRPGEAPGREGQPGQSYEELTIPYNYGDLTFT